MHICELVWQCQAKKKGEKNLQMVLQKNVQKITKTCTVPPNTSPTFLPSFKLPSTGKKVNMNVLRNLNQLHMYRCIFCMRPLNHQGMFSQNLPFQTSHYVCEKNNFIIYSLHMLKLIMQVSPEQDNQAKSATLMPKRWTSRTFCLLLVVQILFQFRFLHSAFFDAR